MGEPVLRPARSAHCGPVRGAVLLAAVALASLTASWAAAASSRPRSVVEVTVVPLDALEAELLTRLNALRRSRGRRPLRPSAPLATAADTHSRSLAKRGLFVHRLPGAPPFYRRVRKFYAARGYRGWTVGENIVAASPGLTAAGAIQAWLATPSHRRNLLSRGWREVGFGAVQATNAPGVWAGGATTIVTADFGARRRR
jgi:uncharacterized protein YkwD